MSGSDCDDNNASLNQNDLDLDGYSTCMDDCNDTDPITYPGSAELDSATLCMTDIDGDGYGGIAPAFGATREMIVMTWMV